MSLFKLAALFSHICVCQIPRVCMCRVFAPGAVPIGWYLQPDAAHTGRGSDALVEKRRADKMLIARMLDMQEAIMTEKVQSQKCFILFAFSVHDLVV